MKIPRCGCSHLPRAAGARTLGGGEGLDAALSSYLGERERPNSDIDPSSVSPGSGWSGRSRQCGVQASVRDTGRAQAGEAGLSKVGEQKGTRPKPQRRVGCTPFLFTRTVVCGVLYYACESAPTQSAVAPDTSLAKTLGRYGSLLVFAHVCAKLEREPRKRGQTSKRAQRVVRFRVEWKVKAVRAWG